MYRVVRVCLKCQGEFRPEVEVCPDCNVTLGYRETIEGQPSPQPRPLPEREPAAVVRTGHLAYVKDLVKRLADAGIPYHVVGDAEMHDLYRVLVREYDEEAACAVDGECYREFVLDDHGVTELSRDHCPACGASVPPQAAECSDCGLPFPEALG